MLSAPKDPGRLHNLDEWWIERRLLSRKMLDVGEHRTAYLIARDAALPARDIYKTEQEFTAGWIALRFLNDPATAAQHFARIGVGSVNPTALARAGYWQGRAAEAAGRAQEARAAYTAAAEQSTSYYGQLARAKLGLPQIELNGAPGARGRAASNGWKSSARCSCSMQLDERELAIPIFADMGENGDPDALAGLGELAARNSDARGMLLLGKAALNRGLPFDFYAYPVTGIPPFKPIGPEVEQSIVYAIARQESAFNPAVVSPAQAYGLMQVTPDAGALCLQATRRDLRPRPAEERSGLQRRARRRRTRRADRGLSRLLHHDLRRPTMPAAAASRNGSSATAIRATPRSTRSTGSSRSRSPRPATTCSGSWRICRSIARASAAARGCRSRPTCAAAPASNSRADLKTADPTSGSLARIRACCRAQTPARHSALPAFNRCDLAATPAGPSHAMPYGQRKTPGSFLPGVLSSVFKSFGIRSCAERERSGTQCSGP